MKKLSNGGTPGQVAGNFLTKSSFICPFGHSRKDPHSSEARKMFVSDNSPECIRMYKGGRGVNFNSSVGKILYMDDFWNDPFFSRY